MKKQVKYLLTVLFAMFILINVVAAFHAYKFTHFTTADVDKTKDASQLSVGKKIKTILLGIDNPRPENNKTPSHSFETITVQSNKLIECWWIKANNPKGSVIIFHGYSGNKASMLDKADEFLKLGYNTLLVDFMGSGGSEGDQTTIGYKEAEEVKDCFEYLNKSGQQKIFLFGTSMGAAAIIKAIKDYKLAPQGIILECPFGSMYKSTCARFRQLNIPSVPMACLLDVWGGIENDFNALQYKPADYAKEVMCPTLLMLGGQDEKVSREEIDELYGNLRGSKTLKIYPLSGHDNYLLQYKRQWVSDIDTFLNKFTGN